MPVKLARRLAVVALSLAAVGCYAYRPVRTAPEAGSRVRIVLATATPVTTVAPDGASTPHDGILELSGTVAAAAADTISVRLGELRTARGAVQVVEASVAKVPMAVVARIEQRQFRAGTTALAGFGLATIALGAFLIVIIVSITQGF